MNTKEMTLKQFIEKTFETSPMSAISAAEKLIELECIENWLNMMYGVELVIKIRPVERKEGRFYGRSLLDNIK